MNEMSTARGLYPVTNKLEYMQSPAWASRDGGDRKGKGRGKGGVQQYGERIEKLSQQDQLSKFCMDAGFLNVVEIGQYFMTKDTAEFSQFHAVACREYTLPKEEEASQPKGWI